MAGAFAPLNRQNEREGAPFAQSIRLYSLGLSAPPCESRVISLYALRIADSFIFELKAHKMFRGPPTD